MCAIIEQAKSHLCAAKCCNNLAASKEEVYRTNCESMLLYVPRLQVDIYFGKKQIRALRALQVSRDTCISSGLLFFAEILQTFPADEQI